MNRKNLTAAVLAGLAGAAGIAGTAQAVNINPDGLGEVLIYPYYTVNGDNLTLLSVVNTSEDAKAVKVRFLEGKNSREVLDFNLYMSAYDVWTAAIVDGGTAPYLLTEDTSCTVPDLGGMQAFLPWGMNDVKKDTFRPITDAYEGYVEMIEMGTLVNTGKPEFDDDDKLTKRGGSAWAATHKSGVPNDCGQLVDAWTDPSDIVDGDEGYWLNEAEGPSTDIEPPSGGMFGGGAVINVQGGTMYSYDAKAINGFSTDDINGDLHFAPGSVQPSLNDGDVWTATVFLDNGATWNSPLFGRGVDAVSFVFMHDAVMNEYTTEAALGASTEWVMTFPTKQFYVYEPASGDSDPVAPFTSVWNFTEDDPDTEDKNEEKLTLPCEVVSLDSIWDREERTIVPDEPTGNEIPPIVSPKPPVDPPETDPLIPFELCYEVNVIRFGAEGPGTSEILGSSNFINFDNEALDFEYGWARVELDDYKVDANENGFIDEDDPAENLSRDPLGNIEGLPITGFAVMRFANAFLGDGADVLANYGGIFQHKATRKGAAQ